METATESSCCSVNSFVSYWFAVSLEAVSKPSSAAIKTLFGVMRFRGSGLEAESSLGLGYSEKK